MAKENSDSYFIPILLMGLSILFYAEKYVFNLLLANHLRIGLYGDFYLGLQTLTIVASFLLLGTGKSARRFLSEYLVQDTEQAHSYVHWNLRVITYSCAFFFFIVLGVLLYIQPLDLNFFEKHHLAFYLILLAPLSALGALLGSYLTCNRNIFWVLFLSNGCFYTFWIILLLANIYLFKWEFSTTLLWLFSFIVFLMLALAEIFLVNGKMAKLLVKAIKLGKKADKSKNELWVKTSSRLMTSQVLFIILSSIDIYIVKFLCPNKIDVDCYAAMLTIGGILILLSNSIFQFIYPYATPLLCSHKENTLQKMMNTGNRVNVIVLSLFLSLMLYYRKLLLSHFGDAYITASTPLAILLIGYFISGLTSFFSALVISAGEEKWLTYVNAGELVLFLVMGSILTYGYGIWGMAVASTSCLFLYGIFVIILVRKRLKLRLLSIF